MDRLDMYYDYYVVGKGKLKGKIVYFDDDMIGKSGCMYPGAFREGYVVMPFSYIEREATEAEILQHEKDGKSICQY